MHVIGTAGHVDHGKSTLVEAMTGIDPDRLKEEKERAMTIDLGFAWMSLGAGQSEVGIIDVPGHRDFIENMLAGVGGIDLALLVIAADEGVMPQTKEHLAILDLLQVSTGLVALTKIDLVDDPDWLELITLDILDTLSGTVLADAQVISVSAITGQGINDLRVALSEELRKAPPRVDIGRPRLPIDRVFTLSGFGTIVTGTLLEGCLTIGDVVEVQPGGVRGRIRGLQTHGAKLDIALPGSRVAVNLTGIDKIALHRGAVVTYPGVTRATLLCDALYRHLPDAQGPLNHNTEVKVFVGSSETVAKTRVLGQKLIMPGETGWLQLAFRQPVAVSRGDRYILRRPSPAATIGGGRILDPHPGRRHRRFRPEVISRLQILAEGTPEEVLLQTATRLEPVRRNELLQSTGLPIKEAEEAWLDLHKRQVIREVNGFTYTEVGWQSNQKQAIGILKQYHKTRPLRLGIGREELRSRLQIEASIFNVLLGELLQLEAVVEEQGFIRLPEHTINFSGEQQQAIDRVLGKLAGEGVNSSSVKEVRSELSDGVYSALIDLGQIVQLSADVVYSAPVYREIVSLVKGYLTRNGKISAAELRDLLNTSRKYAIAVLEHLDDTHVTRRQGDYRVMAE